MPKLSNESRNESLKRIKEEFHAKFETTLKEANERKFRPLSNFHKILKDKQGSMNNRYEYLRKQSVCKDNDKGSRLNVTKRHTQSVNTSLENIHKTESRNVAQALEVESSSEAIDDLDDLPIQLPKEHLREVE